MIKVGIDIGGTFTDFIVISNNKLYKNKVLTSAKNPYISFIEGLNEVFETNQLDKNKIEIIIHGTTLFTNKLIERKGTIPLFFTTKGFIDLLDMQNEMRYDIYDLHAEEVKHLVPKFMRFEVDESVDTSGKIHKKINTRLIANILNKINKIKKLDGNNSKVGFSVKHKITRDVYGVFLKSIGKDKAKYEAVNRRDEEEDFGGLEDEMEMANGVDGGAL